MKLIASIKVNGVTDNVIQIGEDTFEDATVQSLNDDPATPYVIESHGTDLFLSFGLEEGTEIEATLHNPIDGEYYVDSKFHVIEYPDKVITALIGGHPIHRPQH